MQTIEPIRSRLERLTTRELARIADREGIDIPSDLDRIFIIQELLENAGQDLPSPEPNVPPPGGKLEAAPLPRQYNITWLEILPRDPQWVFAFWEIKVQDRERLETAPDFEGYCLRARLSGADTVFTVAVGGGDNAWYLGFPPRRGTYTVELGAGFRTEDQSVEEQAFKVLATSVRFAMPRLPDPAEQQERFSNPLVRLSGAPLFSAFRGGKAPFPGSA